VEKALRPNDGHTIGAKVGEEVLDWCLEYGIKTLTLYTFSTENFDRPAESSEETIVSTLKRSESKLSAEQTSSQKVSKTR